MIKKIHQFQENIQANRELYVLLLIGGLYSAGIFLSNTFVNIYLWKQSGDYITIAVYNLAAVVFQPLTFIFAGKIAKRVDRIIVLRLGVLFLSVFFLAVLLIGEKASTYNFMLGSLLGIGYGFYWLAFNVLTFEITEPETRDFFNGFLGILQSLGGMAGPLLAGYIIARMTDDLGYSVIFAVSFLLFACAVGCSFLLKRRGAEGSFRFMRILQERHVNKNWGRILHAHFFQGLREGIFAFIISIWIFVVTNSELALGAFNMLLSGLSLVFYILSTKFIRPAKRKQAILIGALLLYFSIFIILFEVNMSLLLVYAVMIGIAYPIMNVAYVSMTFDVIGRAWEAKEMRIEYVVVRELYLNGGRVLSILVFLAGILLYPAETVIPVLLAIFGAGHVGAYFSVRRIRLNNSLPKQVMLKDQITDEKNR